MNVVTTNRLTEHHFPEYKDEFVYIMSHYTKYGNVPDKETMAINFPDFDFLNVQESNKYLIEKLYEQYLYTQLVPVINRVAVYIQEDSNKAVDYMKTEIQRLNNLQANYSAGYDIVKNANDRLEDYIKRKQVKGLLGIPTGLDDLTKLLQGWLPEDFVVIVGRTNEGKSWILLFFLVMAWAIGKRVLLYSGEMGNMMVGYRFDTLLEHFSNFGLMNGQDNLGNTDTPMSTAQYEAYIKRLGESPVPFIIVTPKDLGGKRMDIPTLHNLIDLHKPDMVGIDQVSLMEDYRARSGEQTRIKYTHISEDLYATSEKYQIPILADAQASRKASESKKGEAMPDAPELDEIGESDGIGQNATRVIGIKQTGAGLKMAIKKNRYGLNNQEFVYLWDIDKGRLNITQLSSTTTDTKISADEYMNGEDVF
jgi:replicative DNA helicase